MINLIEPLSEPFMIRGLLLSVLLGISGGIMGCILLLRRMSLMGDALAHSLLPGLGIAYLFFGPNVWALFAGALIAGLVTALGSGLISRLTRLKEDAAFGSLFIVCFGVGVALISASGTRMDLLKFLFGNILGVSPVDLWLALGVCTITLAVFSIFYRSIFIETFDPIFHQTVTGREGWMHLGLLALTVLNLVAALQSMGIVLSLGLFLLPAVTAYLWCDRWGLMLGVSVACAVAGSVIGLYASYFLDLASGSCIVAVLGVFFLFSTLASPKYGLASRFIRTSRHRAEEGDSLCDRP